MTKSNTKVNENTIRSDDESEMLRLRNVKGNRMRKIPFVSVFI